MRRERIAGCEVRLVSCCLVVVLVHWGDDEEAEAKGLGGADAALERDAEGWGVRDFQDALKFHSRVKAGRARFVEVFSATRHGAKGVGIEAEPACFRLALQPGYEVLPFAQWHALAVFFA